jgi:hypothetical protein
VRTSSIFTETTDIYGVAGERRQGAAEPSRDLVGYGLELGPPGQGDHDLRVECLHHGAVRDGADHDVARQQQPDAAVDVQGLIATRLSKQILL